MNRATLKLIDNRRMRVWLFPKPCLQGLRRKTFKRLGWIWGVGRVRVSVTILKV